MKKLTMEEWQLKLTKLGIKWAWLANPCAYPMPQPSDWKAFFQAAKKIYDQRPEPFTIEGK